VLNSESNVRPICSVGSVLLRSAAEVFQTLGGMFGPLAPRIPDDETGDRSLWVRFQNEAMGRAARLTKFEEYQLAAGDAYHRGTSDSAPGGCDNRTDGRIDVTR
jgi:hypothetical protein